MTAEGVEAGETLVQLARAGDARAVVGRTVALPGPGRRPSVKLEPPGISFKSGHLSTRHIYVTAVNLLA